VFYQVYRKVLLELILTLVKKVFTLCIIKGPLVVIFLSLSLFLAVF